MRYIREVSDIHLDFDIRAAQAAKLPYSLEHAWVPEALPEDRDTCLVIAGDLWYDRRFLTKKYSDGDSWLGRVAKRFKYVVFVLGNHDYWETNISTEVAKIRSELQQQKLFNVFLLDNNFVILDGVKFLGGTLWTDFDRGNPLLMLQATDIMNDYKYIRAGANYHALNTDIVAGLHARARKFILENAKRDAPGQKVVVVTHMCPSMASINDIYKTTPESCLHNFLYASNLDYELDGTEIDLWFHGHTHHACDYMLGDARVVCNPRGYVGEPQHGFDPRWRVEA
jgi:predicted MPP superfamily phosphohydrolase